MPLEKASVLVLTNSADPNISTMAAVSCAQQLAHALNAPFSILAVSAGEPPTELMGELQTVGARQVLLTHLPQVTVVTAEVAAATAVEAVRETGACFIVGAATSAERDALPRTAGLLDIPMITDLLSLAVESGKLTAKRPVYAGSLVATVMVEGGRAVISARVTAFQPPQRYEENTPTERLEPANLSLLTAATWISSDSGSTGRPDLSSARVVVSGGRPLRDAETFERLIGGLADRLGGATGATRAAVDSGIAPNELQVGQTGKTVAPELYIAAGISGSVQHLAGMKDSRTIVAINTDPEAPIFEVADYGLVADLYQALPEMISKL